MHYFPPEATTTLYAGNILTNTTLCYRVSRWSLKFLSNVFSTCIFLPCRSRPNSVTTYFNQQKKFHTCYLDDQCIVHVPSSDLKFQMRTRLGRYENLFHLMIFKIFFWFFLPLSLQWTAVLPLNECSDWTFS